jgi:hypothetical protein
MVWGGGVVEIKRLPLSLAVLVVANLLPLVGVVFFGWSVFELVALYWMENVVIGVLNVSKMLLVKSEGGVPIIARLGTAVFFTVHYGMFCFGHGVFVASFLGSKDWTSGPNLNPFSMVGDVVASGGGLMVAGLLASHGFSFIHHYLIRGERTRTDLAKLMAAPYGRIVVLHLAILFGAFLISVMGEPIAMLVLLVAGKIALDAKLHLKAHRTA